MRRARKVAIGWSAGAAAGTVVLAGALAVILPGGAPAADAPACGGIAPNPSMEQVSAPRGAPRDYLFTPAAPVPRSTPANKMPKLGTDSTLAVDGHQKAQDVASGSKPARQDFPARAAVAFFAGRNRDRVSRDCVNARLAAYTVKEEVQNPANGEWGPSATVPAGSTAHYRVTVVNSGSVALTGLLVKDPWCTGLPPAFDLDAGVSKVLTCDHPNLAENDDGHVSTATVSGVTSAGGKLGDQKATATITVTPLPLIDKIGDRVWRDLNRNGLQDDGEPGVGGIAVTLKDGAGGTVATVKSADDGSYLFDKLKDGTYQVCFDVSRLPDGLKVTTRAAGDPAKDSDADPATGCAAAFTLGGSHRENPDADLGLAPPPSSSTAVPPPAPSS